MTIKANQLTAYDDAAKEVEKAADILERINVARFNAQDVRKLHDVLLQVKTLRHELFSEAHGRFLADRRGE